MPPFRWSFLFLVWYRKKRKMDRRKIVIRSLNWLLQPFPYACFFSFFFKFCLFQIVLFVNSITSWQFLPDTLFNKKRPQNKDFILEIYPTTKEKYGQMLKTYLLINSSVHLKYSASDAGLECLYTHSKPFTRGFIIFYYLMCTTEKGKIGSFTFMIPFHCVIFVLTLFIVGTLW